MGFRTWQLQGALLLLRVLPTFKGPSLVRCRSALAAKDATMTPKRTAEGATKQIQIGEKVLPRFVQGAHQHERPTLSLCCAPAVGYPFKIQRVMSP